MHRIMIGYSGHAFVVLDSAQHSDMPYTHYCESQQKEYNPFELKYLGIDTEQLIANNEFFVGIGNNKVRKTIATRYEGIGKYSTVIHPNAVVAKRSAIGEGSFLAAGSILNPIVEIGKGVICNTGSIIEHECIVGDFAHIAPGAVLAGNVTVGSATFVGANAVIKQGVTIGKNVIVGAGTVILSDVPDDAVVVGNPGKIIKYNNK